MGLHFHSDRGSQYSSQMVRKPLEVIGANLSMSAGCSHFTLNSRVRQIGGGSVALLV